MKPGQSSKTAELVCMGRAVANAAPPVPAYSDPTAFALLPAAAQARVERATQSTPPKGMRAGFDRGYLRKQSKIMVARTVAIDELIRAARSPQVVILGAGLDGRAWRMPELRDAVVFEVDHPDSQREKRSRVGTLSQTAREVRFLPVDFARDSLAEALATAGHDSRQPTTWIWEGVVMYLTQAEVEATLAVVQQRSAPGSRLAVIYHSPALFLMLVGFVVKRMGEPLRSAFTPEQMRELLARYGFLVLDDAGLETLGRRLSPELARDTKVANHLRLASAAFG